MARHIETRLKVGGAVIFWRLASASSQEKLKDRLAGIGHVTLAPEKRQLRSCLKDAIEASVATKENLTRPLSKLNGFALVEEERGERRNEYKHILSAWLEGDDRPELKITPSWTDLADKIRSAFSAQQDILRPAQVGGMLTTAIKLFGGAALREMGGIYWLPHDRIERWEPITEAAETSSCQGKTTCYLLRNVLDADAVRAVRDAICAEVSSSSQRLYSEIMDGGLKKRALATRQEEAESLREKIALYETLLDTGLGELRAGLDMVEQAAAAAVLLTAGGVASE